MPVNRRLLWLACFVAVSCTSPGPRVDGSATAATTQAPRLSPQGGTFTTAQTVSIDASTSARIHYTLDGSAPTTSSPVYAGPIWLNTPTTLRAIALADGESPSSEAAETYAFRGLRLLWMGESIYYSGELWDFTAGFWTAEAGTPLVSDVAAYSGHDVGVALVEFADETHAFEHGAWVRKERGMPFAAYDATVFEFGANDAGHLSVDDFRRTYDKLLHQLHKAGIPRVCAGVAPPHSDDRLTWTIPPHELSGPGGHYGALGPLWAKWGASHTDHVADFTALVASGKYTVAELSDGVHFRYPHGHREAARSIAACLLSAGPVKSAAPEIPGAVVNDLFGEATAGAWSLTRMAPLQSRVGQLHRIAGYEGEWVHQATVTGARLRFPARSARDIWLRYYVDSGSGGAFAWYIDRGTPAEISGSIGTLYPSGFDHHPYSRLIASELPPGPHQIEIETINDGPVRFQGVTYIGVQ